MRTLIVALAFASIAPAQHHSKRRTRCHTRACSIRVQAKRDARMPMHAAVASFYGPDSGSSLACGGTLTDSTLGVANKTLPCGHRLRVCSRRCVMTQVVDRGPYIAGRDFDETIGLARATGFPIGAGVATIRVSD